MPRGTRLHRLPQRLDYALIPAPLDLSLPLASEKSPLPAIIVTPSSPTHETDFSIAFLAPPQKPTVLERVRKSLPSASAVQFKARTTVLLLLLLFIMACHLLTHRLAINRRYIDFSAVDGAASLARDGPIPNTAVPVNAAAPPHTGIWEGLQWLLDVADPVEGDQKRDFVIRGKTL